MDEKTQTNLGFDNPYSNGHVRPSRARGPNWWKRGFLITIAVLGSIAGYGYYFYATLPDPSTLRSCLTTTMYSVRLCPSDENYVTIGQTSEIFIHALVLTEDAAFFGHDGVDFNELYNSLQTNLEDGGFSRGGSTITQQLVKNVYLTKDKTLTRKLREVITAFQIEKLYGKKEILEKYINVVEFGPNVYGLRAAARHYFGKSPSQLNLLESAYLVHLLPSPDVYSRTFDNKRLTAFSRGRVKEISRRLMLFGRIDESQFRSAEASIDQFPWGSIDDSNLKRTLKSYLPGPNERRMHQVEMAPTNPDAAEALDATETAGTNAAPVETEAERNAREQQRILEMLRQEENAATATPGNPATKDETFDEEPTPAL